MARDLRAESLAANEIEEITVIIARYRTSGDEGLEDYALDELKRGAAYVRRIQAHDAFAQAASSDAGGKGD